MTQVSAYIVLLDQTDPQLAVWPRSIQDLGIRSSAERVLRPAVRRQNLARNVNICTGLK